jgi:ubiquinone/menaquinone biosynthesis C-methylase UbiE
MRPNEHCKENTMKDIWGSLRFERGWQSSDADSGEYIHGFSQAEQDRLWRQAEFAEQTVYAEVDLSDCERVLEVGSGVGAQTAILLRRFPHIRVQGIDLNPQQISTARINLDALPYTQGRYSIERMNAESMTFDSHTYDGAFLCWVLEHVRHPERILAEVRRVVRPGGRVFITEVMNSSFFLDPYSPQLWKYWMAFNDYQYERYGDPFVGAKIGNLLMTQGFQQIRTETKVWHYDNRHPVRRRVAIRQWKELMISAAATLVQEGFVDQQTVDGMIREIDAVQQNPNAVFFDAFMQASAVVMN